MNKDLTPRDERYDTSEYNRIVVKACSAFFIALTVLGLAILFLCYSSPKAKAQERDSVSMMLISPEQAIGYMGHELRIADREFKQGLALNAAGTILMIAGFSMNDEFEDNDPHTAKANPFKPICIGIGGAMNLIGIILHIDSRSHLAKGGRIYLTPQGSLALKLGK